MEVAYTLAQLKADSAAILPVLCSQLEKEDDPRAIANMLLSLGVLSESTIATRSLMEPMLMLQSEEEHALVRYTAAVSLAWLFGEDTPEVAILMLLNLLTQNIPKWLFEAYMELPWADGR